MALYRTIHSRENRDCCEERISLLVVRFVRILLFSRRLIGLDENRNSFSPTGFAHFLGFQFRRFLGLVMASIRVFVVECEGIMGERLKKRISSNRDVWIILITSWATLIRSVIFSPTSHAECSKFHKTMTLLALGRNFPILVRKSSRRKPQRTE